MKVLFAVNNDKIAESIIRKYQEEYKEIISSKTVYYFNAIIKELQKDKSYDRIVISEDLEMFSNDNYQAIDKFVFEKMDAISDEATNLEGNDVPIIFLCTDRRTKNDPLLSKLFGLGIYGVLVGQDRSVSKVCSLLYRPRSKKEAKQYYKVESENVKYEAEDTSSGVSETEIQNIVYHYKKIGNNVQKCVKSFDSIYAQYTEDQVRLIVNVLPVSSRLILEENSDTYRNLMGIKSKKSSGLSRENEKDYVEKTIVSENKLTKPVIIPTQVNTKKVVKIADFDDEIKQKEERRKRKEQLAREKAEAEAKRKEEERIAREKAEAEAKRKEEERIAREKAAAEAKRKEEERIAREKAAAEAKRKEEERIAREKAAAEAKRKEEERIAREKAAAEAKRKEEERIAREKAAAEAKRKEEERIAREKAEAEAKRKEEERIAREKAEAEAKRKKEEKIAKEKAAIEEINKKKMNKKIKSEEKNETEIVEPVKRGRGRPRKNVVEAVVEDVVQSATPEKKKRGRPRKTISEEVVEKVVKDNIDKVEEKATKNKLQKEILEDEEINKDDLLLNFDDLNDYEEEKAESKELKDDDLDLIDFDEDIPESEDNDTGSEDDDFDLSKFGEYDDDVELSDFNDDDDELDLMDLDEEDDDDLDVSEFDEEDDDDLDLSEFDEEDDDDLDLSEFDEEDDDDLDLSEFDEEDEDDLDLSELDDEEDDDLDLTDFDDENEDELDLPETDEDDDELDLPEFDEDDDDLDLTDFDDEGDDELDLPETDEDDDELDLTDFDEEDDELDLPEFDDEDEEDINLAEGDDAEDDEQSIDLLDFDDEDDEEDETDDLLNFDNEDVKNNQSDEFDVGKLDDEDEDDEGNDEFEENKDEVKQHNGNFVGINNKNYKYGNDLANSIKDLQETEESQTYNAEIDNLITSNQKVVAFVGTSKNGTSFTVNNLADILSERGIKTAILDLTKNKNAFYTYTNNEESLRETAYHCLEKLRNGIAEGINVNNNLSVYTCLPGEDDSLDDATNIIQTLIDNYTVVLLDCDFETRDKYFKAAQEIYLVQTLDVLTIQPLTAFLRDLKVKGILNSGKLRIVINKNIKVSSITEKMLIGGMSSYNDPGMTYMTELFNIDSIKYTTIPFDSQVYIKYLEGLINCRISTKKYPKSFINSLNKLADMVYPVLNGKKEKIYNDYSKKNKKFENAFSDNTNSTLNKMKKNY